MYAYYIKKKIDGGNSYQYIESCSLFGCNIGLIPKLLRNKIGLLQSEPYKWHVEIQRGMSQDDKLAGFTVIIDLKPKQNKENISLYELMDVWGYSDSGWSPILLHLHGLLVDEDPNGIDRSKFSIEDYDREGPIYEFMYLNGSVSDGRLVGRWTSPPASPG